MHTVTLLRVLLQTGSFHVVVLVVLCQKDQGLLDHVELVVTKMKEYNSVHFSIILWIHLNFIHLVCANIGANPFEVNQLNRSLSCSKNDEFACRNNAEDVCVPMSNRCDGIVHCDMAADEVRCPSSPGNN